ncbi:MAG: hypothetical protein CO034_02455 [Parcubacteria group bacterium CG_4_9_14_0_2_um_filter_35_11]|nr:MAG: hypothetical protein COS98_02355 [Parcubacteria group bacterium CG07_land_8_20_14_0_80_35_11]PJC47462.1 MAG: hypothetical protein CO034_02455 [Parcubacteria group bacterium CG_4_9_14_0_2_um_filter_35_11]
MSDLILYFSQFLRILLSLWWLWLAILLFKPTKYLWLWAARETKFYDRIKWVLLEIKIPAEVEKTPKAMENVFHAIWNMYDPPANIRDYWIDGKWMEYYSLEIVGKRGEIHFYIRVPEVRRTVLESAIYGEYPNAQIEEVEDYVYAFGKDLPNEDYDTWASDMQLIKPDTFPIRTYDYWETELTREEKKIDPLAGLFEIYSNLKEGEEVWVQLRIAPVTDDEHPYLEESKKLINELMRRPKEEKPGILGPLSFSKVPSDIWTVLMEGKPIPTHLKEKMPEGLDIGLMKLSPGEAEVLKLTEGNLGKYVYEGNLRFIYVAKREVYSPGRGVAAIMGAFTQFSTANLNGFKPDKTKTKVVPWFFEERRMYVRKKKNFRYYAKRMWPWHRKPYIFSTAEIATMYHFPGRAVAPSAAALRVEIKKGGPPPTLPT